MSLTIGTIAPLGRPIGGSHNIDIPASPAHLLYLHDLAPRLRAIVEGVTVVDTTAGRMLHETRMLPRWYLPRAGVRTELLEESATTSHCPFKGDARYWHLRVGDRVVEDAFWEYPEVLPGAPDLRGLLSPYLDRWGTWFEEDEEVVGHPRDPFHRVDVLRSSRPVTVRVAGTVVARADTALAVNETGFPTRWYLPPSSVTAGVLTPTDTTTICPYKGTASYWTVTVGDVTIPDAVWAYADPRPEAGALHGAQSFLGEGIEVEVGAGAG